MPYSTKPIIIIRGLLSEDDAEGQRSALHDVLFNMTREIGGLNIQSADDIITIFTTDRATPQTPITRVEVWVYIPHDMPVFDIEGTIRRGLGALISQVAPNALIEVSVSRFINME